MICAKRCTTFCGIRGSFRQAAKRSAIASRRSISRKMQLRLIRGVRLSTQTLHRINILGYTRQPSRTIRANSLQPYSTDRPKPHQMRGRKLTRPAESSINRAGRPIFRILGAVVTIEYAKLLVSIDFSIFGRRCGQAGPHRTYVNDPIPCKSAFSPNINELVQFA